MPARLNPYLTFAGNARAAMEFYRDVFGGELGLTTFGEFGAAAGEQAEKVMHAQLETASGFVLMASDNMPGMELHPGDTMTVSLSGDDRDDLRRYWEALIEGGQVLMPLAKQVWGDEYGMCRDPSSPVTLGQGHDGGIGAAQAHVGASGHQVPDPHPVLTAEFCDVQLSTDDRRVQPRLGGGAELTVDQVCGLGDDHRGGHERP